MPILHALLLLAAASASSPAEPHLFVAPDGVFSARFVGEPELVDGAWQVIRGNATCAVAWRPQKPEPEERYRELFLKLVLDNMAASIDDSGTGRVVSSDAAKFEGASSRRFTIESTPADGTGKTQMGRIVRTDTRVLLIACDAPSDAFDRTAAEAFVASLRLDPKQ